MFKKRTSILFLMIFPLLVAVALMSGLQSPTAQAAPNAPDIPNAPGDPDSKGLDFWLAFPENAGGADGLSLFITSDVDTSGMISATGISFSTAFTVTANEVTTIIIPSTASISAVDTVTDQGIHVTAENEIAVYGANLVSATSDAYLALPTDILGTEYIVLTYENVNPKVVNGTQFAIIGTEMTTTVTITPSVTAAGHPAGTAYTILLGQGQTYQLREALTVDVDLSGSIITSDRPIGVFGSHSCANIPAGNTACDHIVEQLPPTEGWGQEFATIPLATRLNGDTFRFIASTDATIVSIDGSPVATLDRGEYYEQIVDGAAHITASGPIMVSQYYDGVTSDPFMMLLPPVEQFLANYTVSTPASGFSINYINVVAPNAVVGSITLDGVSIPSGDFTAIGSSGYSGAQVLVTLGSHTLTGPLAFGVSSCGFDTANSYGYAGGASFSEVALIDNITLTPPTATNPVGTQHCLTATVADQNTDPLAGIPVNFNVTGVNPTTGFDTTDATGEASFCYTGANGGADTIMASAGSISTTATANWDAFAALALTKTAEDLNGAPLYVGDIIRYTIDITNENDSAMTNVVVTDTLPAGVTFDSATPTADSGPNPLVWNVGSLAAGANWTATVDVIVDGSANPIGGNVATVNSDQQDEQNTPPVLPPGGGDISNEADLAISQSISNNFLKTIFTIVVQNDGPDAAPGAVVSATFPVEIANITWTCVGTGGATCAASGSGNTIDDTLGSFPNGGVVTYTISTRVFGDSVYTNAAEVIPPVGVTDPDLSNNYSEQGTAYLVLLPLVFNSTSLVTAP